MMMGDKIMALWALRRAFFFFFFRHE